MKYILPLLLAFVFTGCATSVYTLPDSEKNGIVQKTYNHSFDELFTASINVLTDEGWSIQNSDRESGLIITDWNSNGGFEAFLVGNRRDKVNLRITKESNSENMVFVNVTRETQSGLSGWNKVTISKAMAEDNVKPFFDKLEAELNQ